MERQNAKTVRIFKQKDIKKYESERALGQMFRSIAKEPTFEQTAKESWVDPRLQGRSVPSEYEGYLRAAALYKAQYEFHLAGILRR